MPRRSYEYGDEHMRGAGEGNRTLVVSLEGFCSTIELHPHFNDIAAIRSSVLQQRRCEDADGTRTTIWSTMTQIVAVPASDVRSAPVMTLLGRFRASTVTLRWGIGIQPDEQAISIKTVQIL